MTAVFGIPGHPSGEPYLYVNEDKAAIKAPCGWDKLPRTLRDVLLHGPSIGEMGPELYLNEDNARGVWDKCPRTLRDAPPPWALIGGTGLYL